jgi:hypothetical protein
MRLSLMQQILEANKPASEKQKEELARLDAEELSEINKLPKVPTKVVVRKIDNKKDFSINVINDQLSNGQSVDVTYEEDGVQKTAVFFKDQDGVLKYDNAEGEAVDLKLDIKFNSGEIFEILNRPTDEDVAEVKKTYDALRAEAAEKAIEEGIKPFTAEQIAELDAINADTPIEAMPPELKQQLVDAYDEYRARPENKSMFPDNLTEEDLQNKFATFIKSESEALEIIEKYVKDKKILSFLRLLFQQLETETGGIRDLELTPERNLNGSFISRNGSLITQNTSGTTNFRVDGNGLLIARQIDVHLDPIPDYVFHATFNKDSAELYSKIGKYKKLSLYEIDDFVKKYHHLPGIKSATQYSAIGTVNIGELNVKLLEKVEELTLYAISQQKEIDCIKKQLQKKETNSTAQIKPRQNNNTTNGFLIATCALFVFIIGRGQFSKLINK